MKISVVIPALNEAKHIGAALTTLQAQTYSDYEVIVVDNGSNDGTSEVAKQFAVKVVTESRRGLLWAREAGRQAAQGEIIANLDADCLPPPDWLSRGTKFFTDSKVVAVTGPYDYYDGGNFFRSLSLWSQKYIYLAANNWLQKFGWGAVLIGGNNFIRAQALNQVGGYNTTLTFYGEDTDTAKRVATVGQIIFSRNLIQPTSARRFKTEGIWRLTLRYLYHFFKVIFSNA